MLRILKILFCVSAAFLLAIAAGMSVSAADMGYETLPLPQEEIDRIWDDIEFEVMSNHASLDEFSTSIITFDVSEDHNIVMGLRGDVLGGDGFRRDKIVVINSSGEVLHYYTFSESGNFHVMWHKDNILLHSERGRDITEISLDGKLVNYMLLNSHSSKNSELEEAFRKNKMVVDNYTYKMVGSFWGGVSSPFEN